LTYKFGRHSLSGEAVLKDLNRNGTAHDFGPSASRAGLVLSRGYHKGGLGPERERIMYTCMFGSPLSPEYFERPERISLPLDAAGFCTRYPEANFRSYVEESPSVTESWLEKYERVKTELQQILKSVDERPTVAGYMGAAREIRVLKEPLSPARLSLLATFTLDSLVPYLEVEAARKNFAADVYIGPFNAVTQELLNPTSGCLSHRPDVVFIAHQLSDLCPPLVNDYSTLDDAKIRQYVGEIVAAITATLTEFRKLTQAAVVMHNFALPAYQLLGIYEAMAPGSQTKMIRSLNERLADAVKAVPGSYILDYERLCSEIGYRNWYDDKMWHLGRAPLSAQALPILARAQAAFVQALLGQPRKCLVLDLDNTLWGGVIGEDGLASIKLGHTYPGSAFRHFQQVLLQLHRQGVILAINSKNNGADVEEVFRSHPDMLLRPEHFASARINWQDKPQNMLELAEELNMGLDSMVFFDDNPAERELMKQTFPQVLTLEVPGDPLKYSQVLLESRAFDKLSFTEEDRRRGEMYRQQVGRRELENSATSLQEFYENLQMAVSICPVDEFAFPRVLDLLHKTNQFNLTTRRHSATQLTEMVADPKCGLFYLRVADRFGDYGIVGVAIGQMRGAIAYLDTLLLSCRVIGRTVETAFLSFLVDWARTQGATEIEGEFIATAKNAPAADFYSRHGFTQIRSNGAVSRWRLSLDNVSWQWPSYIQLISEEQA